jgi:putative tryptophan/tyrosine transport system substrate-binding protein
LVLDVVLGAGEAMRRREFIAFAGSTVAAWPFTARAQQSERMRRIGVLMSVRESDPEAQNWLGVFGEGLQQLGWTAGRNIRLDYRWAAPSDAESRQRVGKELVALQPDLILTQNTVSTASILQETRSIPIIFANVVDPIGSGFVSSLARPGGNVTGFTLVESSIVGKWLELIKEIAPRVSRVAFLFNPAAAPYAQYYLDVFKAAAPSLGMEAIAAPINKTSDIEPVIAEHARDQNGGLFLMPDTFLLVHRVEVTSLAGRYALRTVTTLKPAA